jgi:hypothetical protein
MCRSFCMIHTHVAVWRRQCCTCCPACKHAWVLPYSFFLPICINGLLHADGWCVMVPRCHRSCLLCSLGGGGFTLLLHYAGRRLCCVVYCLVECMLIAVGTAAKASCMMLCVSVIDAFCTAMTAQWDLTPFAEAWVVPHMGHHPGAHMHLPQCWAVVHCQCGRCMILCLHAAFSPCVCSLPAGFLVTCLGCMC